MTRLNDAALDHLRRMATHPELLDDRFEILETIGQGGMGIVYRTYDRTLAREVALKVLRAELTDASAVQRLERESRILARLDHPGVVPVHDVGQLADGRTYYLMRFIAGKRLDELAADTTTSERLRLFLRVVETIEYAHSRDVIHRDLKPANIMLGSFGEVLVLDWGIARAPDLVADKALGTPGFMAPEQERGDPSLIDRRTDVFGLGATLRWLLAGRGEPIPRPLRAICDRAMAPTPDDRYPTARDLAADITHFLDGAPVAAYKESIVERVGRIYRRYQTPILLVVAYLVMRLLFLVFQQRG